MHVRGLATLPRWGTTEQTLGKRRGIIPYVGNSNRGNSQSKRFEAEWVQLVLGTARGLWRARRVGDEVRQVWAGRMADQAFVWTWKGSSFYLE